MHIKPIRSFPKMLLVLVAAVAVAVGASWMGYKRLKNQVDGAPGSVASIVSPAVNGPSLSAPTTAAPKFVDERVAFVPRIGGRPWTAPAYDELRKVDKLPIITGAVCMSGECKCYSGAQYLAEVSSDQCGDWLKSPPYQPYKVITGEGSPGSQGSGHQQDNNQPDRGA